MDITLFKNLGFSDKSATVYGTLLRLGPASVRQLAAESGLNRGTTYDCLKWLQGYGLVNFYHKDTKQYFVAEDPVKLYQLVETKTSELATVKDNLDRFVPELRSLYDRGGERPVARYYEGATGLHEILSDVLSTVEKSPERLYRIYSAIKIREYLYEGFKNFSEERIKRNIHVRVIAVGEGGELRGLDERKWIVSHRDSQTYIILYEGKTAYIALKAGGEPIGVVIDNDGVFHTQKMIFDHLWDKIDVHE